jgi:hypothetical protein
MTKTPKFKEFSKSFTTDYEPPKYLVKPQPDDKGWEILKTAFDDQKTYFKPGIKSSNKNLKTHEY